MFDDPKKDEFVFNRTDDEKRNIIREWISYAKTLPDDGRDIMRKLIDELKETITSKKKGKKNGESKKRAKRKETAKTEKSNKVSAKKDKSKKSKKSIN